MKYAKTRWWAAGLAGTLALSMAGCSAGGGTATPAQEAPTAFEGEPVTIQYWGSKPQLEPVVELFNEQQDTITVEFTEQAGDMELATALRNAHAAGNAPCVFDTQTEQLTSFVSDEIASDVTEVATPYQADYSEHAWNAVTLGEQTFGLPAASIPAFMLFNSRVFEEAGLEYPTTWEEFIEAGKVLNENGSKIYNLAPEDYTTFVYLAWQAGAQWWQLEGDSWKVDVDSEATSRAADTIQQMIDNEIVESISYAEYAAMMQEYNDGAIASRQLSTWQTAGMQNNLTSGLGEWEAAPNPTFEGEDPANVSFTRVYGIETQCEDPEAAAFFANWMATDEEAVALLANQIEGAGWFPAVADPAPFIDETEPTKLLGDHTDSWEPTVQNAVETQKGDWTYGPNTAAAFEVLADQWGKAVAGEIKVADIAPFMQDWIVKDLEQSGISVTE
ncbi:extracellular solute-binding protein [Arthrobacter sp. JZ12]|uniref:ABC transporter substrate-binding protein n=1 Tax=Arthrobacter sp. JZ12 TaxID=2654190 RepID=UPI002B4A62CB|nr:hypothetical protein [Arthrobacter sp. JZ12]WRH25336.1 extracellular solute-binding protein [Arthrobacter sp. JZ12]